VNDDSISTLASQMASLTATAQAHHEEVRRDVSRLEAKIDSVLVPHAKQLAELDQRVVVLEREHAATRNWLRGVIVSVALAILGLIGDAIWAGWVHPR
jgi:hypothetical protein